MVPIFGLRIVVEFRLFGTLEILAQGEPLHHILPSAGQEPVKIHLEMLVEEEGIFQIPQKFVLQK